MNSTHALFLIRVTLVIGFNEPCRSDQFLQAHRSHRRSQVYFLPGLYYIIYFIPENDTIIMITGRQWRNITYKLSLIISATKITLKSGEACSVLPSRPRSRSLLLLCTYPERSWGGDGEWSSDPSPWAAWNLSIESMIIENEQLGPSHTRARGSFTTSSNMVFLSLKSLVLSLVNLLKLWNSKH